MLVLHNALFQCEYFFVHMHLPLMQNSFMTAIVAEQGSNICKWIYGSGFHADKNSNILCSITNVAILVTMFYKKNSNYSNLSMVLFCHLCFAVSKQCSLTSLGWLTKSNLFCFHPPIWQTILFDHIFTLCPLLTSRKSGPKGGFLPSLISPSQKSYYPNF